MATRARNEGSMYRPQTDGRWVAAISVGIPERPPPPKAVCRCHPGRSRRPADPRTPRSPVVEGQIRGHQRRRLLVALGEDLEQQLGAGLRQRHVAELVHDQHILLGQLCLEAEQALVIQSFEPRNAKVSRLFTTGNVAALMRRSMARGSRSSSSSSQRRNRSRGQSSPSCAPCRATLSYSRRKVGKRRALRWASSRRVDVAITRPLPPAASRSRPPWSSSPAGPGDADTAPGRGGTERDT